jgi:hypothetical protein
MPFSKRVDKRFESHARYHAFPDGLCDLCDLAQLALPHDILVLGREHQPWAYEAFVKLG